MKTILKEIRQQPLHIRKMFMWTMVTITFAFMGFWWVRDTEKTIVALLNPQAKPSSVPVNSALAKSDEASPWANLKASISDLLKKNPVGNSQELQTTAVPVPPQSLPVDR